MPIKKELYPANWPEISKHIRERAGNKCERCGVENYAIGARDNRTGHWHSKLEIHAMTADECLELFDELFPVTHTIKIILTVAHLDQNPANNDDSNLACLCQRCHLNHDRPYNLIKCHQTVLRRHQEQIEGAGQLRLEGVL